MRRPRGRPSKNATDAPTHPPWQHRAGTPVRPPPISKHWGALARRVDDPTSGEPGGTRPRRASAPARPPPACAINARALRAPRRPRPCVALPPDAAPRTHLLTHSHPTLVPLRGRAPPSCYASRRDPPLPPPTPRTWPRAARDSGWHRNLGCCPWRNPSTRLAMGGPVPSWKWKTPSPPPRPPRAIRGRGYSTPPRPSPGAGCVCARRRRHRAPGTARSGIWTVYHRGGHRHHWGWLLDVFLFWTSAPAGGGVLGLTRSVGRVDHSDVRNVCVRIVRCGCVV